MGRSALKGSSKRIKLGFFTGLFPRVGACLWCVFLWCAGCSDSSSSTTASGTQIQGEVTTPGGSLEARRNRVAGSPAVRPQVAVQGATVEAIKADGTVQATATTDSLGSWSMRLPGGTYQLGVRVGSIEQFVPLRSVVGVRGSTVDGAEEENGTPTVDFEVPPAQATVSGTVQAGGSGAGDVSVEFVDPESGEVRYKAVTGSDGSFTVTTLPVGNFTVRLDADTLPAGYAAPSPKNLAVTASGVSPSSLTFTLEVATSVGGQVSATSTLPRLVGVGPREAPPPAPSVVVVSLEVPEGAEVVVSEVGAGEVQRVPIASDGSYRLNLRDGSYRLSFEGFGNDVVAPPPLRITVKDSLVYVEGQDDPIDPGQMSLQVLAQNATTTLSGTVTYGSDPVLTRVVAKDAATGGTVAQVDTGADGSYSLPLAPGSYAVSLAEDLIPAGVIAPDPVRVSVEVGSEGSVTVREEQGTENDGVVSFSFQAATATLTGAVQDSGGTALKDVRVVAWKGTERVARGITDSTGAYSLKLPLGTVQVALKPESLPTGLVPPEPEIIEVLLSENTVEITGDSGTLTALNWTVEAHIPNVGGTITFDFDGDGTVETGEVVGCRILVTSPDSESVLAETWSNPADGTYTLVLKSGTFLIGLDPESLPPGSSAPPPQRVSVSSSGVTTQDGSTGQSATVNFRLVRRAATLSGAVTINGRAASCGLVLFDPSSSRVVNRARSDSVTGLYSMPVFPGKYELKVDSDTLPPGVAPPNPVALGVDSDGTIRTSSGLTQAVNFALSRNVAQLSGAVLVQRGSETLPVETNIEVRDPQSHRVLQTTRTDRSTGSWSVRLLAGSWEIAVDPSFIPPGVLPPLPVTVSVSGTTVSGNGVAGNTLNFTIKDVRLSGASLSGTVYDAGTGTGIPAELRLFDSAVGSARKNFIRAIRTAPDGTYTLKAPDGTYTLSVLPESLPPTATPPADARLAVQGTVVIEDNTSYAGGMPQNGENDGIVNFAVRDGATTGITIGGTVSDPAGNPFGGAQVMVQDSSTEIVVAQMPTDFLQGTYVLRLPLGSYFLQIDPDSLPFNMVPPSKVSILAALQNEQIVVTTNNGQTVTAVSGVYIFNLQLQSADHAVSGTVTDAEGNSVRVFVQALDSRTKAFVAGVWSDPSDGSYRLQLGPGTYDVGVETGSVPFGLSAPAPVGVTVTSSGIVEESGTANDGTVNVTLKSAGQTLRGQVADSSGNPLGCFVRVDDATTGEFVTGMPCNPADGSYSLLVPTGTFNVTVDPPSLPPGYVPPAPQRTQVSAGVTVTVNFTVKSAGQCITGTVLTESAGIPMPVFVKLEDAATEQFINGVPTFPDTGAYRLCAAPGVYKVRIDPDSMPFGMVVPEPVRVQVTDSGITESDETGTGNQANDGVVNFRPVEATAMAQNLAQLTGTVVLQDSGSNFPLGAFVFVEQASDGRFITGSPTNPATGAWSIYVPDGTYDVAVDPLSLPPGVPALKPVRITVSGTTVTQLVEGVPVESSSIDFTLSRSGTEVTGTVTFNGSPFPCFVVAVDPNTDQIVNGAPVDPAGSWRMTLSDDTYLIGVDPPSLPPGFMPPAAVTVTVSSGFVGESAGTANDGVIPFVLTQGGVTLRVQVTDGTQELYAHILVVNTTDTRLASEGPTGPGQEFVTALGDGTYDVVVDPPSLPFDVAPPAPSRIQVSGDSLTLSSPGSGSLTGGLLTITAAGESQAASVTVVVKDSDGTPVGASVRVTDSAGNLLFLAPIPPSAQGGTVVLGDGTYYLGIDPGSVPPGFSLPDAQQVTVSGSSATPSTFELILTNERTTVSGTVRNALDQNSSLLVALDLYNGKGVRIRSGVTLTAVDGTQDATYQVDLGEGVYELRLRRLNGVTSAAVILPSAKSVAVSDGQVQNSDDDPDTAGTQVDITIPPIKATVSGTVTVGGSPLANLTVVLRDPVDNKVVNSTTTAGDGSFTMALPAGSYKIGPEPLSLDVVAPQAVPPQAYELTVSGSGDVSVAQLSDVAPVSDPGQLCTGSGPSEACTGLDFPLSTFSEGQNVLVTGQVLARRNATSDPAPVSGATVLLIDPAKEEPRSSTLTDAGGEYSLIVPNGIWFAVVDVSTASLTYPTIPAAPVRIAVQGLSVNEEDETGQNNTVNDGVVSFLLEGASAFVQGKVQTSGGMGVGARLVVSTADKTEMPEDFAYTIFTDPQGQFFMPVGAGNFKLWVAPESLPPGFLPPRAIVFSVSGSTVSESDTGGSNNTQNDGIINPIVSAGGGTIYGRCVDASGNPLPLFVGLLAPPERSTDPPRFVTGAAADPDTGNFTLTAADGSYFLEVDSYSLPPGLQPPSRVNLSVSTSGGTTQVTYDSSAQTITDGGVTRVVLQAAAASGLVQGTVTDTNGNGVGAVVIVEDAAAGRFVRETFADPASGLYSLSLGDGSYDLFIDPMSVPPGSMPPQQVRVSVQGSSITESNTTGVNPLTQQSNSANDGIVNFVVRQAGALLEGYVQTASASGAFARVSLFAADASGSYTVFINSTNADPSTGYFALGLSEGTYRVEVDPGSIPPGYIVPPPCVVSAMGDQITLPSSAQTVTENGQERILFTLREAEGGVSGTVTLNGSGVPVFVVADDADTGAFMGGAPTDPNGSYAIGLPAGSYKVKIDPFSLPQGVVLPEPQRVTVSSGMETVNFSLSTAQASFEGYVLIPGQSIDTQNPALSCADLDSNTEVTPVACSLMVTVPSNNADTPPTLLSVRNTDPQSGHFSVDLGDGTFEIQVDGGSLPPGVLPPPPVNLTVTGSTVTVNSSVPSCTDDSAKKLIFVVSGGALLRGYVKLADGTGVGAFIEIVDPTEGHFFTGAPTDPATGEFSVTLGARSYELRVEASSLPPGTLAPPPVRISSASDGTISVETVSGVTYQNDLLTIVLSTSSLSVSGSVTDSSGNGFPVQVTAVDAQGNMRGQAWTDPATGGYTLPLPAGSFTISIDPYSLPPGIVPPASQTATLQDQPVTGVDFTISSGAATVSGRVYYTSGQSEVGVPAYVELVRASDGSFVSGGFAQADQNGDFTYSLSVPEGSFRLRLRADSLPTGYVPPSPVTLTVSVGQVTGQASIEEGAHGSDQNLSDGVVDFEFSEAAATLNGRLVDAQDNGLSAFVIAEVNDGSHTLFAQSQTAPDGTFSLSLADGTYQLFVDPMSLPPGYLTPAPKIVTVAGTSIQIDGTQVTGVYSLQVGVASATLPGSVTSGGSAVPYVFVQVTDSANGQFITGAETDEQGQFSLSLGDGTFLVQIEPMTLPPGSTPPAPVQITASGQNVTSGGQALQSLDFTLQTASASVQVQVEDSYGMGVYTRVQVLDSTGANVLQEVEVPALSVSVGLAPGTFYLRIPASALPPNSSPPAPVMVTVGQDNSVQDTSGVPDDGFVRFVLQQSAATISGTVALDTGSLQYLPGVKVGAREDQTDLEVASAWTDSSGAFSLGLPVGVFEISVVSGLPSDAVTPPGELVRVFGPGQVEPSGDIAIVASQRKGLISGAISLNGAPAAGAAVAMTQQGSDWVEVSYVEADSSGNYQMNLAAGTFAVFGALSEPPSSGVVIPPLPQTVTVPDSPDLYTAQVDLAFYTSDDSFAPAHQILSGLVSASGAPVECEIAFVYGGNPMFVVPTQDGQYQIGLIAGDPSPNQYTVLVLPDSLSSSFTAPPPVTIDVDTSGISGTGVAPDGQGAYVLNLGATPAGAVIHGTVSAPDGSGLSGVQVVSSNDDTDSPGPQMLTDSSGFYSLILPEGNYLINLQTGIPDGLVHPVETEVSVSAPQNPGEPYSVTIDGEPSTDGTLNWQLQQAYGHLSGQVTADGQPIEGDIYALVDGEEVSSALVYNGLYDLFLPAGTVRVVVEPMTVPQGKLWPAPYEVDVPQGSEVVELTYDFLFTSQGEGQTLQGQLLVDGSPYEAGLDLYVSEDGGTTWEVYGYMETGTDGTYQATLPPGMYQVIVWQGDLPDGAQVGTDTRIVVETQQILKYSDSQPLANNTLDINVTTSPP